MIEFHKKPFNTYFFEIKLNRKSVHSLCQILNPSLTDFNGFIDNKLLK